MSAWPHVETPRHHHVGHRRRPLTSRYSTTVSGLQIHGLPAHGQIPNRQRSSIRTTITTATHIPNTCFRCREQPDSESARTARLRRPRRRPCHHPMAPPTTPQHHRFRIHHPPAAALCRPDRTSTKETAQDLISAFRSRPPQRNMAIRLHPHLPRQRFRHRNHHLARRPLQIRTPRLRSQTRNRQHRPRHVQRDR